MHSFEKEASTNYGFSTLKVDVATDELSDRLAAKGCYRLVVVIRSALRGEDLMTLASPENRNSSSLVPRPGVFTSAWCPMNCYIC